MARRLVSGGLSISQASIKCKLILRRVIGFACCSVVILAAESFGQINWQRHINNPVVPVWTGNINDPSSYKYTFTPAVLFDSTLNLYRMWFCYQAFGPGVQWCLGYAISTDGVNWFVHSKNPVLVPGSSSAFDGNAIFDPYVIKVGSQFRLYYTGYNGSLWQTGIATSTDGINWTKHASNPVLAVRPATWESRGCNDPKVFFDGARYVMLYTGHSDSLQAEIGLAASVDGYVWERNGSNPVLRRGTNGSGNKSGFSLPAEYTP